MDEASGHRLNRNSRIVHALKTSVFSKVTSILLIFVAMPLLARRLGPEEFGLFATISALPAIFTIFDLGVGPAVSHKLAEGFASGDEELQARFFTLALLFLSAVASIIVLGGILIFAHVDLSHFIKTSDSASSTLRFACMVALTLTGLQLISSLGSKARAGYQEMHINNLFGAMGNVTTTLGLGFVILFHPTMIAALLAVFGTALCFQLLNLGMLVRKRPYLINFAVLSPGSGGTDLKFLLTDSVTFAAAIGLLSWQWELAKFALAGSGGPAEAGKFAILMNVTNLLGGLLVTFTGAIWPAIIDARHRGDGAWLTLVWRRLSRGAILFGCVAGIGIAFGGRRLIEVLYGAQFPISQSAFYILAGFFLSTAMSHVRFTWLMGFKETKKLMIVSSMEFASNGIILGAFFPHLSLFGVLLAFCLNHFIFSVALQHYFVRSLKTTSVPA